MCMHVQFSSVDPLSRCFNNTFYCQAACRCSPCVIIGDPARIVRLSTELGSMSVDVTSGTQESNSRRIGCNS